MLVKRILVLLILFVIFVSLAQAEEKTYTYESAFDPLELRFVESLIENVGDNGEYVAVVRYKDWYVAYSGILFQSGEETEVVIEAVVYQGEKDLERYVLDKEEKVYRRGILEEEAKEIIRNFIEAGKKVEASRQTEC